VVGCGIPEPCGVQARRGTERVLSNVSRGDSPRGVLYERETERERLALRLEAIVDFDDITRGLLYDRVLFLLTIAKVRHILCSSW
jgi:hypothetical protein